MDDYLQIKAPFLKDMKWQRGICGEVSKILSWYVSIFEVFAAYKRLRILDRDNMPCSLLCAKCRDFYSKSTYFIRWFKAHIVFTDKADISSKIHGFQNPSYFITDISTRFCPLILQNFFTIHGQFFEKIWGSVCKFSVNFHCDFLFLSLYNGQIFIEWPYAIL